MGTGAAAVFKLFSDSWKAHTLATNLKSQRSTHLVLSKSQVTLEGPELSSSPGDECREKTFQTCISSAQSTAAGSGASRELLGSSAATEVLVLCSAPLGCDPYGMA